jgi:broad specificity phosphatase PhoE
MKARYILLFLVCCQLSFSQSQNKEIKADETGYYFIRHAEKERSNPKDNNPELNREGKLRALNWAYFFKEIPLEAIYSTNYIRTISTAQPIADDKNLPIIIYNPNELNIKTFMKENQGKLILVVGHSNTTPKLVNAILGDQKFEQMQDNDNSSLFIVRESKGKMSAERITVSY